MRLFGHCHLENGSCNSLKNANGGFRVVLEGKSSKERAIDVWILQDSILRSILFLLNINDLPYDFA